MATTITKTIKSSGGDYSSRSAFEAAIPANIVTTDEIWDGEIYAFSDTTAVAVAGITTDATRYVQFRVATGEGHGGIWDDNKAQLAITAESHSYSVSVNYTRIIRDQVKNSTNNNSYLRAINITGTNVVVRGNIVKESGGITATYRGGINVGAIAGSCFLINNIVYGFITIGSGGISAGNASGNTYAYNNTVQNCTTGILNGEYAVIMNKNNIVQDCTTCYGGTSASASTNNCSDDNTQPGSNGRNGEVTFVDEIGGNFHLSSSDTVALNYGADLSGDPYYSFNDDIDGGTRSGSWDIGADEYVAGGVYNLLADAGSYSETGTAASLLRNALVDAISTSYAETGSNTSLIRNALIDALNGAYVETGTAASLLRNALLDALNGAYVETGQDATLSKGFGLVADAGSYSETGTAASLLRNALVDAINGAYVETGQDATLSAIIALSIIKLALVSLSAPRIANVSLSAPRIANVSLSAPRMTNVQVAA